MHQLLVIIITQLAVFAAGNDVLSDCGPGWQCQASCPHVDRILKSERNSLKIKHILQDYIDLTRCCLSEGEAGVCCKLPPYSKLIQDKQPLCGAKQSLDVAHNIADGDIMLIAGGSYDTDVEVISLTGEPISSCEITVPDLPERGDHGLYFLHKNDPVFCAYNWDHRTCYKYSPASNSWQNLTGMPGEEVKYPTIMELDGYTFFTGGYDINWNERNATIYWDPAQEQFRPGPDLPYAAVHHCIATINQTHALLTGGLGSSLYVKLAFLFNRETRQWTQVEDMLDFRYGHVCGLVGGSRVVVADGSSGYPGEIFDLNTLTWSTGPALPDEIKEAATLQLEDTFLIVAGRSLNTDRRLDTVYEYDVANNDWIRRNQRLKLARRGKPGVWKLPASYLKCT